MNTEITRNLCDSNRYNILPQIAAALDIDRKTNKLWKDKACVELNEAILYSFEKCKVKMVDHHTASKNFSHFMDKEEKKGREVPAKFSWIVPPVSSHLCPIFHKRMVNIQVKPKIDYQPDGWDSKNIFVPRGEVAVIDKTVQPAPKDHKEKSPSLVSLIPYWISALVAFLFALLLL